MSVDWPNKAQVLAEVQEHEWGFEHAWMVKNDPEIVLAAVQQDGRALHFASDVLKNDPKIVMAAVQEDCPAVCFG